VVLSYFVSTIIAPRWPNQCAAFLALTAVINIILCVPRGGVTPEMLKLKIDEFLECCVAAGWEAFLHPKFHWLTHLVDDLRKFKFLPNCWPLERKHKVMKRYGSAMQNTCDYDRAVLYECTGLHLFDLSIADLFVYSVGPVTPRAAPRKMKRLLAKFLELSAEEEAGIMTSVEARYGEVGTCHKGDVVLVPDQGELVAAEVWFHVLVMDIPLTLLALWEPLWRNPVLGSAKWAPTDTRLELFETHDIRGVCTYKRYADGVVTLAPSHLR